MLAGIGEADAGIQYPRGDSRYGNVRAALEHIADQIDVGGKRSVLIKPNFVSTRRQLAATHVDAVRAILDFLHERNIQDVVIAERAAIGKTYDGYRHFGYLPLQERYGVELVDLDHEDWVEAQLYDRKLQPVTVRVARRVVESDFRISVGPPKTHECTIVTLSLKNMVVGSLQDRSTFHAGFQAVHLNLYALAPLVAPHLAVIDAFQGMEGNGPVNGDSVDLRVAIASTDFVAADTVATRITGHEPEEIGYLVYCNRGGLGVGDLHRIHLRGNVGLEEATVAFRKHPDYARERKWAIARVDRFFV